MRVRLLQVRGGILRPLLCRLRDLPGGLRPPEAVRRVQLLPDGRPRRRQRRRRPHRGRARGSRRQLHEEGVRTLPVRVSAAERDQEGGGGHHGLAELHVQDWTVSRLSYRVSTPSMVYNGHLKF